MQIRTTKPGAGNKYYITKAAGGWSNAIVGSPTDKECNVLANCVGYAYGRFNEIGGYGYCKYLAPVNAENFIQYKGSCTVSQEPSVGACMVWQKGPTLSGSDGAGHVAIVEKVNSSTQVFTSESGYGSSAFWNSTRNKGNGNWGANSDYKFLGFIKNPAIADTPIPTPTPTTLKYKLGDVVSFTGILYGDSYGNKPGQSRTNLKATITSVNAKGTTPYNINTGLGWVAERDLRLWSQPTPQPTPTPEPTPQPVEQFPIGTKVRIVGTGSGSSYGRSDTAYGIGWTRYVTNIWYGRPYPYQIGNYGKTDGANTTGFYKAESIQKI